MNRATARLNLDWEANKPEIAPGKLDERFLPGHKRSALVSLPFLPYLYLEVSRSWEKTYSSCVVTSQFYSYADIRGLRESG